MAENEETRRAIVPYQTPSLALDTMDDLIKFGDLMHRSGLFPDVKSAGQAVVKILAGREMGIPPMESLAKIHVVEGKPQPSADLMARIIKRDAARGGYDYRILRLDNTICEIQFLHEGKPLSPTSVFTIEDAKMAQLVGGKRLPWNWYPRNMLFARALTNGAKWHCSHLLGSLSTDADTSEQALDYAEPEIAEATIPTAEQAIQEARRNMTPTQVPRYESPPFGPVPGWPPPPSVDAETGEIIDGDVTDDPDESPMRPTGAAAEMVDLIDRVTEFIAWFRAKAMEVASIGQPDIPAVPFSRRLGAVRDAALDVQGMDTALLNRAVHVLTGKALLANLTAAELVALESVVKAGKVAALLAVAKRGA